mgnify:CR=1 FL=1
MSSAPSTTDRAPLVSLPLPSMTVHALACLILALAFFATPMAQSLPRLRLQETRLAFSIHLLCNAAFLLVLWINARERRAVFHWTALLPFVFLFYAFLSARSAPVPGAAMEDLMFWLDAALLWYVAQHLLARRPDFFLVLYALMGSLLALILSRGALSNSAAIPGDYLFIITTALGSAAVLMIIGRMPVAEQRSFFRFLLLVVTIGVLVFFSLFFATQHFGDPQSLALRQVTNVRPWTGCGVGSIPEILPAFASQDYMSLPLPHNGWVVLRAEMGRLGIGLMVLLLIVPLARTLELFHANNGDGRSFMAAGLAALIALLIVGTFWQSFLARSVGRLFFFLLLGMATGYEHPQPISIANAKGWRAWQPGLAAPFIAVILVLFVTIEESRPYRAARLALSAANSRRPADVLLDATNIYPLEAEHWDQRAAAARTAFRAVPWNENAFQRIVRLYDKSLAADPYRFKTYISLAQIYDLADRKTLMEHTLKKGLQYLPRNETIRRWLVGIMMSRTDTEAALDELEQLALDLPDEQPDSNQKTNARAEMYVRIGEIYEKRGDYDRAQSHYAMALIEDPMGPLSNKINSSIERVKQQLAKSFSG